jgi:hypothetical protein
MAGSQSGSAKNQLRGDKGRFIRDPSKPEEEPRVNGGRIFSALRGTAFRLIKHLESALPSREAKTEKPAQEADKTAAETADAPNPPETSDTPDQPENAEKGKEPEKPKWTAADYDRLLGRHGGVVDSFRTLADLILRLTELEQKRFGTSQFSPTFTEDDEEDLDRRIADELDRLAERRGSARAG